MTIKDFNVTVATKEFGELPVKDYLAVEEARHIICMAEKEGRVNTKEVLYEVLDKLDEPSEQDWSSTTLIPCTEKYGAVKRTLLAPYCTNDQLCASCGGNCCKSMGCMWSVEDFVREYGEVTEENVRAALAAGMIAIDWIDGTPDYYRDEYGNMVDCGEPDQHYIRMRHVGEPEVCGSWGGQCVALTPTGCKFSWEHRPLGGRALFPCTEHACHPLVDKREFVNDWSEYNDMLRWIASDLIDQIGWKKCVHPGPFG